METQDIPSMDAEATSTEEWIVVFYPRTCALRLHPSLHAAQSHISKHSWPIHIYKSPNDLRLRHDHLDLESFWRGIYEEATGKYGLPKYSLAKEQGLPETFAEVPDLPTETFCKELWHFMQLVGDRVIRLSIQHIRSKEHYEVKKAEIQALMADEETFKKAYPKQARQILEALVALESPYVLEADLMRMMNSLVANQKIKSKQDPWRLMQYYRPQYIENGLLVRGDVDASGENEEE